MKHLLRISYNLKTLLSFALPHSGSWACGCGTGCGWSPLSPSPAAGSQHDWASASGPGRPRPHHLWPVPTNLSPGGHSALIEHKKSNARVWRLAMAATTRWRTAIAPRRTRAELRKVVEPVEIGIQVTPEEEDERLLTPPQKEFSRSKKVALAGRSNSLSKKVLRRRINHTNELTRSLAPACFQILKYANVHLKPAELQTKGDTHSFTSVGLWASCSDCDTAHLWASREIVFPTADFIRGAYAMQSETSHYWLKALKPPEGLW